MGTKEWEGGEDNVLGNPKNWTEGHNGVDARPYSGPRCSVWVTAQFTGYHRWEAAPAKVGFLRDMHRHVFHVRVEVAVDHDDRDVEFFILKEAVETIIRMEFAGKTDIGSCEMIARKIHTELNRRHLHVEGDTYCVLSVMQVDVSDDGENGATIRTR